MFVTPAPIRLLVVFVEPGKIAIFAMVLFGIRSIRTIFLTIPLVIVVVLLVVVGARFMIFGSQCCWRQCYWSQKGGAEHGRMEETGHHRFHAGREGSCRAKAKVFVCYALR